MSKDECQVMRNIANTSYHMYQELRRFCEHGDSDWAFLAMQKQFIDAFHEACIEINKSEFNLKVSTRIEDFKDHGY